MLLRYHRGEFQARYHAGHIVKLKYLDEYSQARNRAAGWYDKALRGIRGISIPVRSAFSTHVFHQYTLRLMGIDREASEKP
jgi:dTDP-4-amino-4,6-dideoxygalactose transaminase